MIIVDFIGATATIHNYEWSSNDTVLAKLLNSILSVDGPSGSDPHPDKTAAEDAIKQFGGRIIKISGYDNDDMADRVY